VARGKIGCSAAVIASSILFMHADSGRYNNQGQGASGIYQTVSQTTAFLPQFLSHLEGKVMPQIPVLASKTGGFRIYCTEIAPPGILKAA